MDYFAILGVDRSATAEEIKQAYRRLVRLYHPDVNQSPEATEQFRQVVEAYKTLSDDQQRQAYILSRIRKSRRPRKSRQNHPGADTMHVGFLLMAFFILVWVGDTLYREVIVIAMNAQPTVCTVESWQEVTTERFILHYAASVPWQDDLYINTREFSSRDDSFVPETTFECYYNETWEGTQLWRYDSGVIWDALPWTLFGLVMMYLGGRHFWKRR